MTEIYSVVAAFGTNGDAEDAVQKLERNGLERSVMSIENRLSPIPQQVPEVYADHADTGSWAITGALLGGLLGVIVNDDRFRENTEDVFSNDPFVSCAGFVVKGACLFAGISFISSSVKSEVYRMQNMHDEPTLSVDPYLLVVHGTSAAVKLAGNVLRAEKHFTEARRLGIGRGFASQYRNSESKHSVSGA